jgi:hypothetical protein
MIEYQDISARAELVPDAVDPFIDAWQEAACDAHLPGGCVWKLIGATSRRGEA